MNMSTRRSDFHAAVTRVVETAAPTQQASACADALKREMDTLGIPVNLDYAKEDFRRAADAGRPLVERCMDWWDEVVSGIRYPVACCHVVTGTLPGGYVFHTAVAISVYDRDGKPVARDAVEWADCCSAETNEECYSKFAMAIYEKAADLGARSMFKFIDGMLRSSVSIAHHPEQGPTWFDERSYGKREKDECLGNEPADDGGRSSEAPPASGEARSADPAENDFFAKLKRMRDAKTADDEEESN
jgi:hypothetical protein